MIVRNRFKEVSRLITKPYAMIIMIIVIIHVISTAKSKMKIVAQAVYATSNKMLLLLMLNCKIRNKVQEAISKKIYQRLLRKELR